MYTMQDLQISRLFDIVLTYVFYLNIDGLTSLVNVIADLTFDTLFYTLGGVLS